MIIININSYGDLDLLADDNTSLYSYTGLSDFHQRKVEKIIGSKKPNKVWSYLKCFEFTKKQITLNKKIEENKLC